MGQCKQIPISAWGLAILFVFMSAVADARLIRFENNLQSISAGDLSDGSELVDIRAFDIDGDGGDDDVTAFSMDLFGSTYSQLYVNNNGTVSFGSAFNGDDPSDPSAPPVFAGFFNGGILSGITAGLTSSADSSICSELCLFIDFFFDNDDDVVDPIAQIAIFSNGEGDNGFKVEFNFDTLFDPGEGVFGIFDGNGGGTVYDAAQLDQANTNYDHSFAASVQEPGTLALLFLGLMTMAAIRQMPRPQIARVVER